MKKVSPMADIQPESESIEWKKSLSEWEEIVETCAAFATAKGGRIYVGVAPSGQITGVEIGKGSLEDLANKIGQNTSPRLAPSITLQKEEGKTLIVIDIAKSSVKPIYAFDRAFRRSGRSNQRLSPEEATHLYLDSRGTTWDEMKCEDASIKDLDLKMVRSFLQRAREERRWEIDPKTPAEKVLQQLDLVKDGKPTVAALLLFGKNPQHFFLQSTLRCARFKGDSEVRFLDMKVIEGNIIRQVDEAMAFIERNISMAVEIKGRPARVETWEYPLDALREAITNAVCHRDYADSGDVQVRIFDHRLEVWNPGSLPPELSVEDLSHVHQSKPRNKSIAKAFFLIKFIEQFGTGTVRMIDECRAHHMPDPVFESRPGAFRVIFQKPISIEEKLSDSELSSKQMKAIRYLEKHGKMTRQQYQDLTHTSLATAKRDLSTLVNKGFLTLQGKTRKAFYTLTPFQVSRK